MKTLWSDVWKGGFQLMQILGLLDMQFDVVVVFVKNYSLLFELALASLNATQNNISSPHILIYIYHLVKTQSSYLWGKNGFPSLSWTWISNLMVSLPLHYYLLCTRIMFANLNFEFFTKDLQGFFSWEFSAISILWFNFFSSFHYI